MSTGIKALVGQTAIYGLPTIVGRLLNYLMVPLYTRVFLPAEYGVVTELYAYVALLMVFVTYGMETAFFRFVQKSPNPNLVKSTAQSILLCSSLSFAALVWLLSQPLASALGYASQPDYIALFGFILAMDAICVIPFAVLRQEQRPLRFAWIKTINISVNIACNLFLILLCPYLLRKGIATNLLQWYRPDYGVGYIFVSNFLASVVTLLCLMPQIRQAPFRISRPLLKPMLLYAFPVMIWGISGIVNETIDRVLLKHLLIDQTVAAANLGIYGACYKVSILMTLFIQAFRFAVEPFFFRQAGQNDAPQTYAVLMRYFVIAGLLIFLGCVLFLDDIMLFVGADYRVGAPIVPVLLLANLFLGIFYNLSVWYKITDKTRYGAYIGLFGAVITIGLNLALVPKFGYIGAAWATLVCYVSIALISYWGGQKYYPIPYPLKALGIYFLLGMGLYAGFEYLPIENIWSRRAVATFIWLLFAGIIYLKEIKHHASTRRQ